MFAKFSNIFKKENHFHTGNLKIVNLLDERVHNILIKINNFKLINMMKMIYIIK